SWESAKPGLVDLVMPPKRGRILNFVCTRFGNAFGVLFAFEKREALEVTVARALLMTFISSKQFSKCIKPLYS
ncbi:hypothetical protein, partial [Klebsiella pneumoniae]|uniref:hypothetical protein n=1 Tax=Klebsiella pneumoniae TaxID=573 RepID=UPI00197AE7A6